MAQDLEWLTRDAVARQASIRPNRLAVHDLSAGETLTFGQLEAEVRRAAAFLSHLAEPGARVALLARNSLRHVVLFYACARARTVFVPLNWRLSGPELAVVLEDSAPAVLILDSEFDPAADVALAATPVRHVYRDAAFGAALAACSATAVRGMDPVQPSMLIYTSGTTGRPKGVIVTPATAFYSATNFTFVGEFTADNAHLCDVPLFHVVGLLAVLHVCILAGGRLYLHDRFDPAKTLEILQDPEFHITHYFCVPQIAQTLVEHPGFCTDAVAGLRLFTGGAPMPADVTLRLIDAGARPSNGYGMSENGTILGVPLDPEVARAKVGSAGVASPAVAVRLVGPDGRDAADGEVGEIWLKGPSVTPGYWNQPEISAKAFEDGWFRTGDAARRDADGFYFIVDRWKDMYITGGENVYPAEVEAALGALAGIAEAAVVGVPDPRWGESGCAFLVRRAGAEVSREAVLAWCDERLARYKRPAHVRFVEALPRTASGKVQKDILRRAFQAAATAESPS